MEEGWKEEIAHRTGEFETAYNEGNWDACAALFAPDCKFVPVSGGKEMRDKKEIANFFRNQSERGYPHTTINCIEVNGGGIWAWERGIHKLRGYGNEADEHVGNYITIWKKIDGKWYVYADCASTPT